MSKPTSNRARLRTAPLDENHRAKLAALLHTYGECGAAERVGLSRHSTIRAAVGMPLRPGSQVMIRLYFESVQAEAAAGSERSPG